MFPVDALVDASGWAAGKLHEFGDWVNKTVADSDIGRIATGLGESVAAIPIAELVRRINAGHGSSSWHDSARVARGMATEHDEIGAEVRRISTHLESAWTGAAAQAAQTRLKPVVAVTEAASRTFTANAEHVTTIANGHDELRRSLEPMPQRSAMQQFAHLANPVGFDVERRLAEDNDLAQRNLQRYRSYHTHAQGTRSALTNDYGWIDGFGDRRISIGEPDTTQEHRLQKKRDTGDTGSPGRTGGDGGFGGSGGSGGTGGSGGGHSPGVATRDYDGGDTGRGGTTSWPAPGAQRTAPQVGGTAAASYPVATLPTDGASPDVWRPQALNGLGGGAGSGSSAGSAGGGFSAFTGGGPGAVAGGAGGSGSGVGGSGGRVGGGVLNEQTGGQMRAGASGATGRSGAGGAGMGGAGAGGKQDDKEHKRKVALQDGDLFAATDEENGGKLVDPVTGIRAAPPVIGER